SLSVSHTPTSALATLSLHDALPILRKKIEVRQGKPARADDFLFERRPQADSADEHEQRQQQPHRHAPRPFAQFAFGLHQRPGRADRKSTRLNSSHVKISYAVFCLKK